MGNAAVAASSGQSSSSSGSNASSSSPRIFGLVRHPPSLVWSEEEEEDDDVSQSTAQGPMEAPEDRLLPGAKSVAGGSNSGSQWRLTSEYDKCFHFSVPSICKSSRRPSILVIHSGRGNDGGGDDDDDERAEEDRDDGDSSDGRLSSPHDSSRPSGRSPLSSCYPSTPSPLSSSSSSPSPSSGASSRGLLMRYSSSYSSLFDPLEYTAEEMELPTTPTPESDLGRPNRPVYIVTTAALPWMTGTAINPLLRAKYLSLSHDDVTLVVPWLESSEDRVALYGEEWRNRTVEDHQSYLRTQWLQGSTVALLFYPAKYHSQLSSIFALGDLCELLPTCEDGVCILEEPEHVNFYRAPGLRGWRQKFSHVIGIVHTNYKAYAQHHYSGLVTGPIVGVMSAWMVRAYCDKVIKLSSVLQEYAVEKECVENVHGIRPEFLSPSLRLTGNKIYFIGKLLWCKGLDKLLELEEVYRRTTGAYFEVDVYGSGPEEAEIQRAFGRSSTSARSDKVAPSSYAWRRRPMPVSFPGRVDHASIGGEYKIFVNPSVTEVLCTSTAEAVARGRFVLVPQHPSNDFFAQFPNCLQYKSKSDFCALLQLALSHDPVPLTPEQQHALTWEAATDRLIRAAAVSRRDRARRDRVGLHLDERLAKWHYDWGRGKTGDVLRTVLGGGPVAAQTQYSSTLSLVSATSASSSASSSSPASPSA